MKGGIVMDNHSMMELGEDLNGKFKDLVNYCMLSGVIDLDLYSEYDVKRGLRDSNGKGVLTGLTEISDVIGYKTKNGKELDLYGLIVESLAKNPPLTEITFEEFYKRILELLDSSDVREKPDRQTVRSHLHNLQTILEGKEEIYKAIEWKDGIIYVLDPLFLFYLRWGRFNE